MGDIYYEPDELADLARDPEPGDDITYVIQQIQTDPDAKPLYWSNINLEFVDLNKASLYDDLEMEYAELPPNGEWELLLYAAREVIAYETRHPTPEPYPPDTPLAELYDGD